MLEENSIQIIKINSLVIDKALQIQKIINTKYKINNIIEVKLMIIKIK